MGKVIYIVLLMFAFASGSDSCRDFYEMEAKYVGGMQKYLSGYKEEADSVWKDNYCIDSLAWKITSDLIKQKRTPEEVFRSILETKCDERCGLVSLPIKYVEFTEKRENAKKILMPFYDFLEKSKCSKRCNDVVTIQLDISNVWQPCSTEIFANFKEMMYFLSKEKKDSAFFLLQKKHCGDSIAWDFASNLINKKTSPERVFNWILQENCEESWWYAEIPIYYVHYIEKERQKDILRIFSKMLNEFKCENSAKEIIQNRLKILETQ